jgi:DNA-binding response OmpR family regulator
MKRKVMLMDNNLELIRDVTAALESNGYQVFPASTLDEAEKILREQWFHLGLFDVRMIDEDAREDTSGIELATKVEFAHIPKVILSTYNDFNYALLALKEGINGKHPAFDFILKEEGAGVLLEKLDQYFQQKLNMNWNLQIEVDPSELITIPGLVSTLLPNLSTEHLGDRVEEMGDLFRKLFRDYKAIHLNRIFWRKGDRIALEVLAEANKRERTFLVTCGLKEAILNEIDRVEECAPQGLNQNATSLVGNEQTLHFSASRWELMDANFAELQTMAVMIKEKPVNQIRKAIENLFEVTLNPWRLQGYALEEARDIFPVYCEWTGVESHDVFQERIQKNMTDIIKEGYRRNLVEIQAQQGRLTVRYPKVRGNSGQKFPDPLSSLERPAGLPSGVLRFCHSPGKLELDTLLVNPQGRVWLTDFSSAGHLPVWHDYAFVEAELRALLPNATDLSTLMDMEAPVQSSHYLAEAIYDPTEQELKKIYALIQTIQTLASEQCGAERYPYDSILLLILLSKFVQYNPAARRTDPELGSWLYALLLCGAIAERLERDQPPELQPIKLTIDPGQREVRVANRMANLSETEYRLIFYLYKRANQNVAKNDILSEVFEIAHPGENDDSLVTTNIHRIRKEIEPDPRHPRFIITVRDYGYRLNIEK